MAGAPAILKVSHASEEIAGGALMAWWGGDGAARVLAREGDALLLERATGAALAGRDGARRRGRRGDAHPLRRRRTAARAPPGAAAGQPRAAADLVPATVARPPRRTAGLYAKSAAAARALLAEPREVSVVHGDLHHGNVLDFGPRGWLAIDPKGLSASGRTTTPTSS